MSLFGSGRAAVWAATDVAAAARGHLCNRPLAAPPPFSGSSSSDSASSHASCCRRRRKLRSALALVRGFMLARDVITSPGDVGHSAVMEGQAGQDGSGRSPLDENQDPQAM